MSTTQILLVSAVVIYVIVRRFTGSPVGARTALVPLGLMIYGVTQLHAPLTPIDLGLLVVELALGVLAGVARGYTIRLYEHDGHLWQRYTVTTLLVWIAMIAVRIGFAAGGHLLGATLAVGAAAMITFGVSLLAETLVVARRAAATGTPLLPAAQRGARARVR